MKSQTQKNLKYKVEKTTIGIEICSLGEEELNLNRAKTTEIEDYDHILTNDKLQKHFTNLGNFMSIEGPNSAENSNNESIGFSSGSSTNIFTDQI